jgi:protein Tex
MGRAVNMYDVQALDLSRIAQDLQIRKMQVESVVQLLDEGNTIPFITRYRKERTSGLNEDVLRQIHQRVCYQRHLADRKQTILRSIEGQGKLTCELRTAILAADTSKRLEDLYLPFKPKKKSLAAAARDKGLEPLARAIWSRDPAVANLAESWSSFINPEKGLNAPDDVRTGVQHILAEWIAETVDVRAATRSFLWESGKICASKSDKLAEGQGLDYKDYFDFHESLRHIPPHRILALNRGEKENALKIRLDFSADNIKATVAKIIAEHLLKVATEAAAAATEPPLAAAGDAAAVERLCPEVAYQSPHTPLLRVVLDDALNRLLLPSLEREIRRELTDEAESHAVNIFGRNLRSLLLQPPLQGRRVLAIDPGFRTGCKVVALDEHGNCLEHAVIHPHPTREREKKPAKEQPPAPTAAVTTSSGPSESVAPATASVATSAETPSPCVASSESSPSRNEVASPVPVQAADAVSAATPPTATEPPPSAAAPPAAPTSSKREDSKSKLHDLATRHSLNVIAIGNGTACRETEEFVSELIRDLLPELAYVIVNEAGASVYSASAVGREEFPNHDATVRGTVSIGRRLQDPLSELVKVDPQNIGVGLYQHDVNPRHLKESLETIIESCVNQVGVDLNTASVPLLRHVSGFNQMVARDVVEFRKRGGPFKSREQLLQVPNVGPVRFVQAAGFLKIPGGDNPLDRTWIHPESYGIAARLLSDLGFGPEALDDKSRQDELRQKLKSTNIEETAIKLQVGVPTLRDILDALARPGRDPREELPPPVFKKGILRIEDLQAGMELKGTVLNVVDFGAFVDIGLKDSGLVHISQMANRYIKNPYEVAAVSDVVTVWVLNVDQQRHRVSLTMIRPGTERKPPEREARGPRGQQPADGERGPRPSQQRAGGRPQEKRGPRPGGRPSGPPRRGPGPRPTGQHPAQAAAPPVAESTATHAAASAQSKPPPPPRRPRREPPKPKLSQAALEGRTPLRTFAELGALFAAKKAPPPPDSTPQTQPSTPAAAAASPATESPGAVHETPPPSEPLVTPPLSDQPSAPSVAEGEQPPQGNA